MNKKFVSLPHTADIKFQAFGKSVEEVFKNSAYALTYELTRGKKIKPKEKKVIEVFGKDLESLMYNFLEEFLYLLDSENFILSKIEKLEIKKNKLKAFVSGDKAINYKISNTIKSPTYNDMFIKKGKPGFVAQVVLDV